MAATMRRTSVLALLLAACLCLPAAAAARPKPITGKLSKSGYSVIALGYNGKAATSDKRSFKIVPRDTKVTLQLRDAKGRYAGPVVVGGTKRSAIVGVKAGAKLRTVKIRAGYATLVKKPAAAAIDKKRIAQARNGVPAGNGKNFGLVRSSRPARAGDGLDQDLDGVPDLLDIDANGNLVLNNEDGGALGRARAAQLQTQTFSVFSQIGAPIERSVNANASGAGPAAIDDLVRGTTTPPYQPIGMFMVLHVSGDQVELDCGGLSYCSAGGTGRTRTATGVDPELAFPSCCDPDGDGFGTITPSSRPGPGGGGGPEWTLYPVATPAQIRAGDVLIERSTTGGTETAVPGTLNFVFNTTPALTSWSSSGGQSANVTYPGHQGDPGSNSNPFTVTPGGDDHLVLNLTMWRPQRQAIEGAGEGTGFVDLGHLLWTARVITPQSVIDCNTGYTTTDPNLRTSDDPALGGLVDQSADAPASPANTLSYSIDATACLDAKGAGWQPGQTVELEVVARSQTGGDNSAQQIYFQRGRQ
jgi:hypothetical protein